MAGQGRREAEGEREEDIRWGLYYILRIDLCFLFLNDLTFVDLAMFDGHLSSTNISRLGDQSRSADGTRL